MLLGIGFRLSVALLLLLFLQLGYNPVYRLIAVFFAHLCKSLERILQVDSFRVRHQFIKHLGAFGQLLVVFAVLVQQSDGLAVTTACIAEKFFLPIQVSQVQKQHTFFYATAGGLGISPFIGTDSLHSVPLCEIDVAYGIIYLVKILLVLVGSSHALQLADYLLAVVCSHYLAHGDTCIELQLVRRIESHHVLESSVSLSFVALSGKYLPQEIPLTRFLLAAHLMLDYFAQIGHGKVVPSRMYIIVGIGIIPLLTGTPVYRVALHVAYHVFGIIRPSLLYITLGKPSPCPPVDCRLGLEQAAHISKG